MKISGQLLEKIIKEEISKVLEQNKDVERVTQAVSKASGFEARIKSINTQEELEELLKFVMSKLDTKKINATKAKRAIKTIYNAL